MSIIHLKLIKDLLKSRIKTSVDLASFKREAAKKYKIPCPSNIQLLKSYHNFLENKTIKKSKIIEEILKTRPIRSLSGIVNVSVLTKPYPCPGKCLYCPIEKGIPKSYLSGEPAVERAKALNYDPYWQVKKRLEMLENEGHPTDKVELRIVGGTWSFYSKKYQEWFVKRCFDACNNLQGSDPCKAQKLNEKAKHRIVGLSVETRPDFINEKEIKHLRDLGVTMVELGVQSIYDDVLKINLRGHGVKETISATRFLKDAGFKVLYQVMPDLPGSSLKRDEEMFEELFKNPNFRPDYLKIYPCAVLKEAPLYGWWKRGEYQPYSKEKLLGLIKEIKKKIPHYVRIQRIARDIPSPSVVAGGAKISNLRQLIQKEMEKEEWKCKCIRCREVKGGYNPKEKLKLFRENYEASEGKEIFLSFENKNRTKLFSFLRLRIPKQGHNQFTTVSKVCPIFPVLKNTAIIRKIQTFGAVVPIGEKKIAPQHRGLGKKLLKEAEKIAKREFGLRKMAIISGVGAREYFRKFGCKLKNSYMIKSM